MLKAQISNLSMCFTDLFSIILHKSMYFRADTALGLSIESKPYEGKKEKRMMFVSSMVSTTSAFQKLMDAIAILNKFFCHYYYYSSVEVRS